MASMAELLPLLLKEDCCNPQLLGKLRRCLADNDVGCQSSKVVSVLLVALKSDNEHVVQEALLTLGDCFSDNAFCQTLEQEHCATIFTELCNMMSSSDEKSTCLRCMQCFYVQKFGNFVLENKVEDILLAICDALAKFQLAATVDYEAVRLVEHLVSTTPHAMQAHCKLWWRIILCNVTHPAPRVRCLALDVLRTSYPLLQDNCIVMVDIISELKNNAMKNIIRIFNENEEAFVVNVWVVIVDMLGKMLLCGASLINCLLEVIEKAFRSKSNKTRIQGICAWRHLIGQFGTNLDVLGNAKTLRLLLHPLKSTMIKTDEGIREKISTWWHVAVALQSHLHQYFGMVIETLLQHCFSIDPPKTRPSITSSHPQSEVQNGCRSMQLEYGIQILVLLFEDASVDIRKNNFVFAFESLKAPAFSGCIMFSNHSDVILRSLVVASRIVEDFRPHRNHLLHVWKCVVTYVKVASQENRAVAFKLAAAFLHAVEQVVMHWSLDVSFMLDIIEVAAGLPHDILSSSVIILRSHNLLHDTPCVFLLNMLLQEKFLGIRLSSKRLISVFTKLVSFETAPCVPYLNITHSIIQCIDAAAPGVYQMSLIASMWQIVANHLANYVTRTNDVNQGDLLACDFSCTHAALMVPINHLVWADLSVPIMRAVVRTWMSLYRTFARSAAQFSINVGNMYCEELAAKVLPVIKSKVMSVGQLNNILDMLFNMTKLVDWSYYDGHLCRFDNTLLKMPTMMKSTSNLVTLMNVLDTLIEAFNKCVEETEFIHDNVMESMANAVLDQLQFIFGNVNDEAYIKTLVFLAPVLSKMIHLSDIPNNVLANSRTFTKVKELWKMLTKNILARHKKKYNSSFLVALCPLLEVTLCHQKNSIRTISRQFWHATFAVSYEKVQIPASLREVIEKVEPLMVPGVKSGVSVTTEHDTLDVTSSDLTQKSSSSSSNEMKTCSSTKCVRVLDLSVDSISQDIVKPTESSLQLSKTSSDVNEVVSDLQTLSALDNSNPVPQNIDFVNSSSNDDRDNVVLLSDNENMEREKNSVCSSLVQPEQSSPKSQRQAINKKSNVDVLSKDLHKKKLVLELHRLPVVNGTPDSVEVKEVISSCEQCLTSSVLREVESHKNSVTDGMVSETGRLSRGQQEKSEILLMPLQVDAAPIVGVDGHGEMCREHDGMLTEPAQACESISDCSAVAHTPTKCGSELPRDWHGEASVGHVPSGIEKNTGVTEAANCSDASACVSVKDDDANIMLGNSGAPAIGRRRTRKKNKGKRKRSAIRNMTVTSSLQLLRIFGQRGLKNRKKHHKALLIFTSMDNSSKCNWLQKPAKVIVAKQNVKRTSLEMCSKQKSSDSSEMACNLRMSTCVADSPVPSVSTALETESLDINSAVTSHQAPLCCTDVRLVCDEEEKGSASVNNHISDAAKPEGEDHMVHSFDNSLNKEPAYVTCSDDSVYEVGQDDKGDMPFTSDVCDAQFRDVCQPEEKSVDCNSSGNLECAGPQKNLAVNKVISVLKCLLEGSAVEVDNTSLRQKYEESPLTSPKLSPDGSADCDSLQSTPTVSPMSGILKKRKANTDDESLSSPPSLSKHRRVSFADPIVQGVRTWTPSPVNSRDRKSVHRRLIMSSKEIGALQEHVAPSQSSNLSSSNSSSNCGSPPVADLNCTDPVFPELVNCNEKVEFILHQLTSCMWTRGLSKFLCSREIKTIGDLSALTEMDISKLPVKAPKVKVVRKVLQQYFEASKSRATCEDLPSCDDRSITLGILSLRVEDNCAAINPGSNAVDEPPQLTSGEAIDEVVEMTSVEKNCSPSTASQQILPARCQEYSSVIQAVNVALDTFILNGIEELEPDEMATFSRLYLSAHDKVLKAWVGSRKKDASFPGGI